MSRSRIVALAGGVGGAKLAQGLAQSLGDRLTIIVNTGDDFEHVGLRISPDIDTMLYTLGGIANRAQGWGIEGETWSFMDQLARLGGPTWFQLGDRDVALHSLRSARLRAGDRLTAITNDLAQALGITSNILPMTDSETPTVVCTPDGDLPFQDYFVRLRCDVTITGFRFENIDQARPTPEVEEALASSELSAIVICPSNPYVSIEPILSVPGMKALLKAAGVPIIAVSPIVAGAAIKGPAARMMRDLGFEPSALACARHYSGLIDALVVDSQDAAEAKAVEELGMKVLVTDTIMRTEEDRKRLADECLEFVAKGLQ